MHVPYSTCIFYHIFRSKHGHIHRCKHTHEHVHQCRHKHIHIIPCRICGIYHDVFVTLHIFNTTCTILPVHTWLVVKKHIFPPHIWGRAYYHQQDMHTSIPSYHDTCGIYHSVFIPLKYTLLTCAYLVDGYNATFGMAYIHQDRRDGAAPSDDQALRGSITPSGPQSGESGRNGQPVLRRWALVG